MNEEGRSKSGAKGYQRGTHMRTCKSSNELLYISLHCKTMLHIVQVVNLEIMVNLLAFGHGNR